MGLGTKTFLESFVLVMRLTFFYYFSQKYFELNFLPQIHDSGNNNNNIVGGQRLLTCINLHHFRCHDLYQNFKIYSELLGCD